MIAEIYHIDTITQLLADLSSSGSKTTHNLTELCKNYVSDDLQALKLALHVQVKLYEKAIVEPIEFSAVDSTVNCILQIFKNNENFNVLIEILELVLRAANLNKIEWLLNKFGHIIEGDNISISLIQKLKICIAILNSLLNNPTLKGCEELLIIDVIKKIIVKNCVHESPKIVTFVNCILVPQYLKLRTNNELLKEILPKVQADDQFLTLRCLAEILITTNENSVLHQEWFGKLLQSGLTNSNKHAMHVLKYSLKILSNFERFSITMFPIKEINTIKNLTSFMLIYEGLDETQLHIVEPYLKMMSELQGLSSSWEAIIFQKILRHPSNSVQCYGIETLLQRTYSEELIVIDDLLCCLNKPLLYETKTIQKLLQNFLQNLSPRLFKRFLDACLRMENWLGVPFFYLCFLLHEILQVHVVPEKIVSSLLKITDGILNTHIREGCVRLLFSCRIQLKYSLTMPEIEIFCNHMTKYDIKPDTKLWKESVKWFEENIDETTREQLVDSFFENDKLLKGNFLLFSFEAKCLSQRDIIDRVNLILHSLHEQSNWNINVINNGLKFVSKLLNSLPTNSKADVVESLKKNAELLIDFMLSNISDLLSVATMMIYISIVKEIFISGMEIWWLPKFLINQELSYQYFWISTINNMGSSFRSTYIISEILNPIIITNKNRKWASNYYLELLKLKITLHNNGVDICDTFFTSLQMATKEDIVKNIEVIGSLLVYSQTTKGFYFERVMDVGWKETLQLKRSDLYLNTAKQFIRTLLNCNDVWKICNIYKICLWKYVDLILLESEQVCGLAINLYEELYKFLAKSKYPLEFPEFFTSVLKGFMFGPMLKRDERIENATSQFIESLNLYTAVIENKYELDSKVRVLSIMLLDLMMFKAQDTWISVCEKLIEELILQYKQEKRPRYFAESNTHRKKNRILQTMVLIFGTFQNKSAAFSKSTENMVFNFLKDVLLTESMQLSIRYQIEILFIQLLLINPSLISTLSNCVDELKTKRLSCMISILSVMYHLIKYNSVTYSEAALDIMWPLTMCSLFKVRQYAQVLLYWSKEHLQSNPKLKNKFVIMQEPTEPYLQLQNDFFFKMDFQAVSYLETIFQDLPRLSGLPDESLNLNYIPENMLAYFSIKNPKNDFAEGFIDISSSEKITSDTLPIQNDTLYQKKIIPQSYVDAEHKSISSSEMQSDFVLVASLLTRLPNLGGLSRTCEIFGVKEYVINNLQDLKSKEFKNLSVSSENWINVREVFATELVSFLIDKKSQGYIIAGLEQSTDSICLNKFQFPKKTVLLLGNEKEGIPPKLLALLDACIEIPQCGVTRSLNVHVSGALAIWEYFSQHVQPKL